jgi:hypothetical protein
MMGSMSLEAFCAEILEMSGTMQLPLHLTMSQLVLADWMRELLAITTAYTLEDFVCLSSVCNLCGGCTLNCKGNLL